MPAGSPRSAAVVLALGLVALGCGGSSDAADLSGADIVVDAFDRPFDFGADVYRLRPGTSTIGYVNIERELHSMVIEGATSFRLVVNGQGDTDIGTVELTAGRFALYCDIPGHRAAGMEALLVVE